MERLRIASSTSSFSAAPERPLGSCCGSPVLPERPTGPEVVSWLLSALLARVLSGALSWELARLSEQRLVKMPLSVETAPVGREEGGKEGTGGGRYWRVLLFELYFLISP